MYLYCDFKVVNWLQFLREPNKIPLVFLGLIGLMPENIGETVPLVCNAVPFLGQQITGGAPIDMFFIQGLVLHISRAKLGMTGEEFLYALNISILD